ncbi:MAG: phospho-N-acetylmuramoyl-pentapeptide-transferase [Bacteroidetes bacterium]|nr:phospho-N-acetylmuramoyl-pentapeptide-transferase [Bacteroidota bacterium]MCL2302627.1 phospho-N-acetylmuramoyl-pentapeptide-transferase [Lentimicrobiaceae bacterium]
MLYYFFEWLQQYNIPGAGLFQYISFRAAAAIVLSLLISILFGKKMIRFLQRKQIGEEVRDLGLEGQLAKKGTPTMGGIIIIASILIPVLLVNKLDNIYIILMIFTTLWLGTIGFIDDYIKVFKKNKAGLSGKKKLLGQVVLGFIVGMVICFHPDVVIKEKKHDTQNVMMEREHAFSIENVDKTHTVFTDSQAEHSTKTTIPFFKDNEFDYAVFTRWLGDESGQWTFLFLIPIIIFIIAAVSNGANLTDGLDGLAAGTSAVIAVGIALLAYVSGNAIFADYLNIMYIPNISEVVIFTAALVGACIGFYWYNCFPAQIFMGDTGSLTLGGIIAVLCIIIRKELLIPILCGVFLIQSVSVIIQVVYFRSTKINNYRKAKNISWLKAYQIYRSTPQQLEEFSGKRIFLMTPLHHHYQKKGMHESKIVQHFIIVSILLIIISLVTLKVR